MNSIEARIQAVAEIMRGKHLDEIQSESVYLMGVADKAVSDRITAFGAIRRAVEIARRYDIAEREMAARNYYEAAGVYGRYAENIRRAIRAAIGDAS